MIIDANSHIINFDYNKKSEIKPSICKRISDCYLRCIAKLVTFLDKHNCFLLACALGELLTEPLTCIKLGLQSVLNFKRRFNFYGLNPTKISEEQSKKEPILLLHGNFSNQSAWLSFAKKLKSSGLGTVYTVNLPHGDVTGKDIIIVGKKIDEIKAQYLPHGIECKINLVGHSRGFAVGCINTWCEKKDKSWIVWKDINKLIGRGAFIPKTIRQEIAKIEHNYQQRVYELFGSEDVLERETSDLTLPHTKVIKRGHLGLLTSNEAQQQIIDWLKE